jgi:hypothetical protein
MRFDQIGPKWTQRFPRNIASTVQATQQMYAAKFLTSYFCPFYERTIRVNFVKMKLPSSRAYRGECLQALAVGQARFVDAIAGRILPTTEAAGAKDSDACLPFE